jgi:hypothetical protein
MNVNNNHLLSRSRSKDALNDHQTFKTQKTPQSGNLNYFSRPKSAGNIHVQTVLSPVRHKISNDFQSKREFFENCTHTDYTPTVTNHKVFTLSPTYTNGVSLQPTNQRHVIR